MHYDDQVRAVVTAVAFAAMLAGHYVGDHWIQTCKQACTKPLGGTTSTRVAVFACVRHVVTWGLTVLAALVGAAAWLNLPLRPGWVAAGMALNMVTHFVIDLRVPLIWVARLLGRTSYIEHVQVHRGEKVGVERSGPGTALFHLDQAAHIAFLFLSTLIMAGPA
jgi:hypothetical protein